MPAKSTLYCSFFQSTLRGRQQIWEPVKFSTNLNPAYVSYTQGGKKAFKNLKRHKGSLCQDGSSLNVCHHICTFGIVIWVSTWQLWKREDRKSPGRKEPVFPIIKPQGQEKWLFAGCREGRSLQTWEGRDTAAIQESRWSLSWPYGHCSRCGHHKHRRCLKLWAMRAKLAPQSTGQRTSSRHSHHLGSQGKSWL